MPNLFDVDHFDCVYESWKDTNIPSCVTHVSELVRPGIIVSNYGPEEGLNRPCTLIEAQGVWLFYEWVWDEKGDNLALYPTRITFTLKELSFSPGSGLKVAWIKNDTDLLAAIEEWEEK